MKKETQEKREMVDSKGGIVLKKPAAVTQLQSSLVRDYVIVVDRSRSMTGKRWNQAREAVKYLAKQACAADPDGITLCFFSSTKLYEQYHSVRQETTVQALFDQQKPSNDTRLFMVYS